MKIIAVSNQKGGVGKTTTAVAMLAGLTKDGYNVLGIDLDPQGNLSDNCGAETYRSPTVYELLKGECELDETIQRPRGFDVIPANIMLAGAEQELSRTGKEHRLKEAVSPITANYDFIIIDTPPSLGILTVNAFTFADEVIIPTTPGIFAAKGIKQLYDTVQTVKRYCNPKVEIVGVLITRYNPRTNISKKIIEFTEMLSQKIEIPVYQTRVRSGIVVEESQAISTDIFSYSEASGVAADYKNFITEYLKGVGSDGEEE